MILLEVVTNGKIYCINGRKMRPSTAAQTSAAAAAAAAGLQTGVPICFRATRLMLSTARANSRVWVNALSKNCTDLVVSEKLLKMYDDYIRTLDGEFSIVERQMKRATAHILKNLRRYNGARRVLRKYIKCEIKKVAISRATIAARRKRTRASLVSRDDDDAFAPPKKRRKSL